MDSFAQQMLNEIERRCKAYQLSSISIALNEEFNAKESENSPDAPQQTTFPSNLDHVKDIDFDDGEPILNELNSDETEPYEHPQPETIYANSNVIKQNETYENGSHNHPVPSGRKPALPPKPPNALRLSLVKPKGYAAMAIVNRRSPPGKKDPAEMSLKERLALFEKNKGAIVVPKGLHGLSVPTKQMSNETSHTKSSHVLHTSTLIKTVNQQKPIICDIDIESENDVTPIICESKSNHVEEQKEPKHNLEPNSTPKIKRYDVTDGIRRSASPKPPPPIRKTPEKVRKSLELSVTQTQNTDTTTDTKTESKTEETEALKTESHIEGEKSIENRIKSRENETRAKFIHDIRNGSKLYGDLTPIVTTIAPAKMKPDETIGLNELHQNHQNASSNYSLLSDSNREYQAKEEDRWDRFIECLLFFCCVA